MVAVDLINIVRKIVSADVCHIVNNICGKDRDGLVKFRCLRQGKSLIDHVVLVDLYGKASVLIIKIRYCIAYGDKADKRNGYKSGDPHQNGILFDFFCCTSYVQSITKSGFFIFILCLCAFLYGSFRRFVKLFVFSLCLSCLLFILFAHKQVYLLSALLVFIIGSDTIYNAS